MTRTTKSQMRVKEGLPRKHTIQRRFQSCKCGPVEVSEASLRWLVRFSRGRRKELVQSRNEASTCRLDCRVLPNHQPHA